MSFYFSKILWIIINPYNFFIIIALLAVTSYLLKLKKIYKFLFFFYFSFILLVSFFPIGKYLIHKLEKQYYNLEIPERIDGIIILGGVTNVTLHNDFNEVNVNDSAERLIESVPIIKNNPDVTIIFAGGSGDMLNPNLNHAKVVKAFYEKTGVDTSRIIFETESRNTFENLLYSKEIAEPNHNNTWILITSAFHLKRSTLIAEKLEWKLHPYPVDFKVRKDFKFNISLDLLSNIVYFQNATHEWLGLLYYYFMGRTNKAF
tara:strand:+ start:1248 stop:2027 length:780 start_codon:yes stop_codon:yes gene_type:complete